MRLSAPGRGSGGLDAVPPQEGLLEPGEVVLLSGGRSWHAWVYTVLFLTVGCMCFPLAAVPWLVSCRYWLTQRRLLVQTPFSFHAVALADVSRLEVTPTRATLSLSHRGATLTLRFVEHFRDLWSALTLLREVPVPAIAEAARLTPASGPCTASFRGGFQQGYGVTFTQRFFFLPGDVPRNTAAEFARLGAKVAFSLAGGPVGAQRPLRPWGLWLGLWTHLDPASFEALLARTVETFGGSVQPVAELTVTTPQKATSGEVTYASATPLFG